MSDFPPVVDMPALGHRFEIILGTEDIPRTEDHPPGPFYTRNGLGEWYTQAACNYGCFSPVDGLTQEEIANYRYPSTIVGTFNSR